MTRSPSASVLPPPSVSPPTTRTAGSAVTTRSKANSPPSTSTRRSASRPAINSRSVSVCRFSMSTPRSPTPSTSAPSAQAWAFRVLSRRRRTATSSSRPTIGASATISAPCSRRATIPASASPSFGGRSSRRRHRRLHQ